MKEFLNKISQKMDSAVVTTDPPVNKDAWCGEHDHLSPIGPLKCRDA